MVTLRSGRVEDLKSRRVVELAEELGCTPPALAKAIDEYMNPENGASRSHATSSIAMGPRPCACGCGGTVISKAVKVRFLQGHDAKLKSRLLKQFRNPDLTSEQREEAKQELADWGWL